MHFNAMNQRYWLQYHSLGNLATPTSMTTTHLICPSATLEALAFKQKLVPFHQWLNLTHSDTYHHGPFEFATVNGCKTRDSIAQPDWEILSHQTTWFQNLLPQFNHPSYSIHINRGVHITIWDPSNADALCAATNHDNGCFTLEKWSWAQPVDQPTPFFKGSQKGSVGTSLVITGSRPLDEIVSNHQQQLLLSATCQHL
jgi:hypothetical protein